MSTKAVRTAIALQNLDPNVAYSKCNKDGQLAGQKDTDAPTEAPSVTVTVVVEETKKEEVRNALVEMPGKVEETVEPVSDVEQTEPEEEKKDGETSDVKPRKGGFKKKAVSTDL